MKLERILDRLNSFEKNAFLKIIDNIIAQKPKNIGQIEKILTDKTRDLKDMDSINVSKVFNLVQDKFAEHVTVEFFNTTSQLDILTDIITRDGNCIMREDWLARLYENELKNIDKKIKTLEKHFDNGTADIDEQRQRDYKTYKACLHTAYYNDLAANQDPKITADEQSILYTLSQQLELSQEEIKLINHMVVPVTKLDINILINHLKNIGVIFNSKKYHTVYVADEVVRVLRKIRGKEVADKFFRRVLRLNRESVINQICKKHNIDWRLTYDQKIKEIISEGISFSGVLTNDIYKEGTKILEKKKILNDLCDKGLKIAPTLKGITLEYKIANLIKHFEGIERDEKVGISVDGYEKLLIEMRETLPKLNAHIKDEFELQEENVLKSNYLLDYNIKPRDILEIITQKELEKFCKARDISTRGDEILNILGAYKDAENLYLENFENIGYRNQAALKENGIRIKESELGVKFEYLTKTIFAKLGFNVDEKLRKQLNTRKDKMDIVLNLNNDNLILVECKTVKESGYDKFSAISRQLRSYTDLATTNHYNVIRTIVVAPEFSSEFESDCRQDFELSLSLITAKTLVNILNGLKNSKHSQLPYNLLLKDVIIKEDWVLKAIKK